MRNWCTFTYTLPHRACSTRTRPLPPTSWEDSPLNVGRLVLTRWAGNARRQWSRASVALRWGKKKPTVFLLALQLITGRSRETLTLMSSCHACLSSALIGPRTVMAAKQHWGTCVCVGGGRPHFSRLTDALATTGYGLKRAAVGWQENDWIVNYISQAVAAA